MKLVFLRFLALLIDVFLVFLISFPLKSVLEKTHLFSEDFLYCSEVCATEYYMNWVYVFYFMLSPLFLGGRTFGKYIMGLKIVFGKKWANDKVMIFIRSALVSSWYLVFMYLEKLNWFTGPGLFLTLIVLMFILSCFDKKKRILHDYIVASSLEK